MQLVRYEKNIHRAVAMIISRMLLCVQTRWSVRRANSNATRSTGASTKLGFATVNSTAPIIPTSCLKTAQKVYVVCDRHRMRRVDRWPSG